MRAVVVTFPGSNCDYDVYKAVQQVGGHARFLWHRDVSGALDDADLVLLPGGFSYGDYLRPGAIARFSPVMAEVVRFAEAGGPVLGICNGFQILCEAGLLPGALIRNRSLRFQSGDVLLRVERNDTLFTSEYEVGEVLRIPIANAEGSFVADDETLRRIEDAGQVVFRYSDAAGDATDAANPNGSANSIAGIVNTRGNVLGMMPHPERAMEGILGSTDGFRVFRSLARGLATAAA